MKLFANQNKTVNRVILLPIVSIRPNPAQPRRTFELGELTCLARSIFENGVLQPLTVRLNAYGKYELISGERRLRAAGLAGLKEVPCIVVDTDARQSAVFALIENTKRERLNYFEEALALQNLIYDWGVSREEAARRLFMSPTTIAQKLRLLRFSKRQQDRMIEAGISESQARSLTRLPDTQSVDKAVHYIAGRHLDDAQTERYIDDFLKEEVRPARRFIPVIKDVQVFFNTIDHAVDTMKKAGIDAKVERVDADCYIQYIVKIANP